MNNKKKLPFIVLLIITMLILQLTGCQLAKENLSSTAANSILGCSEDKLCGIFVTIGSSMASVKTEGTLVNHKTIHFPGFEGYFIGLIEEIDANGEKTNCLWADDVFTDTNYSVSIMNEDIENNCETTICFSNDFSNSVFLNSVYQKDDGTYYASNDSAGIFITQQQTNSTGSVTKSNTNTTRENGKIQSQTIFINLNFTMKEEVKSIRIKEMNAKDELIKTTDYLPGDSSKFVVNKDTSYVIVEDIFNTPTKGNESKKVLYTLPDEITSNNQVSHPCYFIRDNDIFQYQAIEFLRK